MTLRRLSLPVFVVVNGLGMAACSPVPAESSRPAAPEAVVESEGTEEEVHPAPSTIVVRPQFVANSAIGQALDWDCPDGTNCLQDGRNKPLDGGFVGFVDRGKFMVEPTAGGNYPVKQVKFVLEDATVTPPVRLQLEGYRVTGPPSQRDQLHWLLKRSEAEGWESWSRHNTSYRDGKITQELFYPVKSIEIVYTNQGADVTLNQDQISLIRIETE